MLTFWRGKPRSSQNSAIFPVITVLELERGILNITPSDPAKAQFYVPGWTIGFFHLFADAS